MKTQLFILYLIIINIVTFVLFGLDKSRAKRRGWRIPEATLFFFTLIGGSLGAEIGMYGFHHKTQHPQFIIGIPVILLLQIILIFFLVQYL
ncbi:MAG: DUF1294 domain-containing protein [Clostridia bacterium]|nr:DUF1294 domain-containing protein [Lachnospiraceae bacterium]NCC00516.1 DUF1294 domain-containing protein [Clostridia bacterium]NCD02525.1 DUF1294 domain-containing protein [Clostridia bacterium]